MNIYQGIKDETQQSKGTLAFAHPTPGVSSPVSSRRLEILLISPAEPHLKGAGVEQRAFFHLDTLAALGRVHYLMGAIPQQVARGIDLSEAETVCASPQALPLITTIGKKSKIPGITLLSRFFHARNAGYLPVPEALHRWLEEVRDIRFDLVVCFQLRSFTLWESIRTHLKTKGTVLFVDLDDISSIASSRELETMGHHFGLETRWLLRLDAALARRLEMRVCRTADLVGICSDLDRDKLKAMAKVSGEILVMPNTIPMRDPLPVKVLSGVATLVFVGTMSYLPNQDAARYLCHEILPVLRQCFAGKLQILLVGKNPSPAVMELGLLPDVIVTGAVDDVADYYDKADLVVVCIRFGGGTRIKILEAMMFEKPVVATTIGAEGLTLQPNEEIVIADEPDTFAQACARLLEDTELRTKIAKSGRAAVLKHYERSMVQKGLRARLSQVMGS